MQLFRNFFSPLHSSCACDSVEYSKRFGYLLLTNCHGPTPVTMDELGVGMGPWGGCWQMANGHCSRTSCVCHDSTDAFSL